MFTYAVPRACPGCRAPLAPPVPSCHACGLRLTGPAPLRVFESLAEVDRLVASMYAGLVLVEAVPAAAASAPGPVPEPPEATRPGRGLGAASVPRILLGLGALCLVVAAIVFLAVAWAALGIGGRTGVLTVLTVVAAGLTAWLSRRDLRAGAEAFAAVALGLLALDLGGAWRAGWLGALGEDPFLLVSGTVVALAAAALARGVASAPVGALVGPQLIGVLAVLAASLGAPDALGRGDAAGVLAALLLCAGFATLGHGIGLRWLALGAAAGSAVWWLVLVAVGAGRLGPFTVSHVWGELAAWPLVVATGLVAVLALPRRLPARARVAAASVAVLMGTVLLTVVVVDEGATRVALVELGVVAAYAVLVVRLPGAWRWVCAAPSAFASLGLATSVALLVQVALPVLEAPEPWSMAVTDRLEAPDVPWTWPLLLPVGVVGIAVAAATVLRCAGRGPRAAVAPGAVAALAALALVPPLYGAPVVVAAGALLVAGGVLAVGGAVRERVEVLVLAGLMLLMALGAALASDWVTVGTLALLTAAGVALEVVPPRTWSDIGAGLAPLTAAGFLWSLQHLAGLDGAARPLPILLVLGAAVVLLPRAAREISSAVAAAVVVGEAVLTSGHVDEAWLAVHLTVAGVLAVVSALVNDRPHMARVGLGLLTLAQWVRLEQLGVETVEAYTLPLALVLLTVGVVRMRRGDASSTRALGPGLALAIVPSLLQVMVDPVDTRAVLLGLACLLLVAVAVWQGWSAPLLAGAVTVALVVLRQGTLAQVLPQWVLIGLVGVVLTVVGVTWERRLVELRRASAYVRGLR